jgi:hypothetical protein
MDLMAHTCPRCSRVNPAEALYCYNDGTSLGNGAARARPGTQEFPMPFVFPSGQTCRTFDQLALACLDNWGTAQELLRDGVLAGFMGGLGRADLAVAAREAARYPDRDRGLDGFLAKLPTETLSPPRLNVEPKQLNLGVLRVGQDARLELHLYNQGMGLLHGSIHCEGCTWLAFDGGAKQKVFQFLHDAVIPLHVQGKQLRAHNKPQEGRLTFESNGGTLTVTVTIDVPVRPFAGGVLDGAKSPRQIAEKAKAHPKEAAVLFQAGAVERWYKDNGWSYPVQAPSSSGLGAVQQFFEALGLVKPPKVEVSESAVYLNGKPGEALKHLLQVTAQEKRPVWAHAVSDQPWLRVNRVLLEGRTATVHLAVPTVPHCPGEALTAQLTVTANGNQRFVVPVRLTVAGRPTGRPSGPVLDVLEVTDAPLPASAAVVTSAWGPPPAPLRVPAVLPADAVVGTATEPRPKATTVPRPETLPEVLPVLQEAPASVESTSRPGCGALALLPVVFLLLGLFVTLVRDAVTWFRKPGGRTDDDVAAALDGPPLIGLRFHDTPLNVTLGSTGIKPGQAGAGGAGRRPAVWEPSMRFGLVMLKEKDPQRFGHLKRLTFEEQGLTNNCVVRLDGNEWIFGERPFVVNGREIASWPGQWQENEMARNLGGGREGKRSIWLYPDQRVIVTQTAEVVASGQSGYRDTCLVRYRLENKDSRAHTVGLRFLLDTFIGSNDGVPFLIPGEKQLCDTFKDFGGPDQVPDFIQACERESLLDPGTIAQVQFRLGGSLEAPGRVTLGAWPNPLLGEANRRLRGAVLQEKTLWQVPVLPIKSLTPPDSAVVMYWPERPLQPGEAREVGFAYGLGKVSGGEGGGKLALTVGGSFLPGGEFTVTAYVNNPAPGQTVTLSLPEGFGLSSGAATQTVPPVPPGAARSTSPVTWKVRAPSKEGRYTLKVQSSNGASQTHPLRIRDRVIFGSN